MLSPFRIFAEVKLIIFPDTTDENHTFFPAGVVHTAGDLHQMFDAIARFGFDYAVNEEFAPQTERLTGISIDAAHRYGRRWVPSLRSRCWYVTAATVRFWMAFTGWEGPKSPS